MSASHPLLHIDAEALLELIDRYYSGENVDALIKAFGICCSPCSLWRYFPPEATAFDCPICDAPMVRPRHSRTNGSQHKVMPIRCSQCRHEDSSNCSCSECKVVRQRAASEKRQRDLRAIGDFCKSRWTYCEIDIEPQRLTAETAIVLLSLIRSNGWINETTIGPLQNSTIPFVPKDFRFRLQLINNLLEDGLIAPSLASPPQAFHHSSSGEISWDTDAVHWHLLFRDPPMFISQLECLVASSDWPMGWRDGCVSLWRQLAAAECIEFCAHSVAQRGLPMPGNTALSMLTGNLLQDFSVAQCYQLIWCSASDATDFRVRKRVNAKHAANYMIGVCQRRADRSRVEGWSVKGFKRNFQLPRSQLSHVLHDVFLKHGESGFVETPHLTSLGNPGI